MRKAGQKISEAQADYFPASSELSPAPNQFDESNDDQTNNYQTNDY
jgi:hypothetical protein